MGLIPSIIPRESGGTILTWDILGAEDLGNKIKYTYLVNAIGLGPIGDAIAKIKAYILSVTDLPVDVPTEIEVKPVKKRIFGDYIVEIYIPKQHAEPTKLIHRKFRFKNVKT